MWLVKRREKKKGVREVVCEYKDRVTRPYLDWDLDYLCLSKVVTKFAPYFPKVVTKFAPYFSDSEKSSLIFLRPEKYSP